MATIIKEGYLKKQGHSWHTWKQRWFVLASDQTLKYYAKQNDGVPIGVIDISKATISTVIKKTAFGTLINYLFTVVASEGSSQGRTFVNRAYYFQAKSDSEVEEWIQAVKDAQKRPAPIDKTSTKLSLPVTKKRVILVSGATGQVGQYLVEELAKKKGVVVRAGTRDPTKPSFLNKLGVEIVELNYTKPETIDKALEGVDTLFLLTSGFTMVEDSLKLVEAAKKAKVQYIVKLGGINPNTPSFILGKMHLAIENAVKSSGIQYALLRPNSFHQNIGAYFGQPIKAGQDIYCTFGDKAKVAYLDTRDIGAVAAEVLIRQSEFQGKTIDLNGPESLDHHQIAASISKVIGRPVKYVDLPPEHWKSIMKGYGMSEPMLDAMINLYDEYKAGRVAPVSNEIEQILKRKPITMEQYIKDNVHLFAPEPRKVLVLGATGNVGVDTVKNLVTKNGIKVFAGTRNPEKAEYFRYLGAEPVEFDVTKPLTMDKALEGVHTVFLLTLFSPFMVEEATKVLEAIKKAGTVKYIVKLGGINPEHPDFILGKVHLQIENMIKETVSEWAFLRPNSFHQNMGNFFGAAIKNGADIYSAFGNVSKLTYVDSRDVGAVAAEVLARPQDFNGKIINLNGDESLDHHQIAAIISKHIGRTVKYIDIPDEEYRKAMKGYGFPDAMIDIMLNLYKEYQAGRVAGGSGKEIEEILGRKATTFEQYLKDHLSLFVNAPPKRILVTGAAGNIGSRVARSLLFNAGLSNTTIRVAVRNAEKAVPLRDLGAEVAVIDANRPETLDAALRDVERLVLIPPFSDEAPKVAAAWVQAAKRNGVKVIVKTGGAGSDKRLFPMSQWHDDNEKDIAASGISHVFVRPTFVHSNFTNQIAAIKESGKFYQSFGNGAVSFLDPRDYGELITKIVASHDLSPYLGNVYTITGPVAITCNDIAQSLSKALNRDVVYITLTEDQAAQGMINSGTPEVIAKGLAALTNVAPTGGLAYVSPALFQLIGRHGYHFDSFVRHYIADYTPKYRFGVLGTGNVGKALAAGLAKKGHSVMIGSRDASKIAQFAKESGCKTGSVQEAAAFAEIVILASNWEGAEPTLKLAGSSLSGKILLDPTNPIMGSFELAVGHTSSGGELVQSWAPDAKVVKCWNIVGAAHMVDPEFAGGPPDMWIAGNDEEAKKTVGKLLGTVGWNSIDGGDIKYSRYLEPLAMIWISYMFKNNMNYNHVFKLLKK